MKHWTPWEYDYAITLKNNRWTYTQIGRKLGRTAHAVKQKILARPVVEPEYPTRKIHLSELPFFYEKGWRVVEHYSFMVIINWPHPKAHESNTSSSCTASTEPLAQTF